MKEELLRKDLVEYALQSVRNRLAERVKEYPDERLLEIILKDAESAYDYAGRMQFRRGIQRWVPFKFEVGEKIISTSAEYSYKYANDSLHGRFEQGERAISTSAEYSLHYAEDVLKGRFELGEEAISKDATCASTYARDVLKATTDNGRFPLGEEAISKDAQASYDYAKTIGERFVPGEEAISEDTELMYLYAKDVCGGRLPDEMHNKMVMLSFSDSGDEWVKKYTKAKKYMTKRRRRIAS